MPKINRETILSLFLAFVVVWFGIKEIMNPESWIVFMPDFLDVTKDMAKYLVMLHGGILIISGLALILNWKRRVASTVIFMMILSIVITLVSGGGLNEIAVRDVGLLGMALALSFRS